LEIALENERRKGKATAEKMKTILNEEHQKKIDDHVRKVFKDFEKWIGFYTVARDFFYNDLMDAITQGYNYDPMFHRRAEHLGLDPTIKVSIDSHFKQGSFDRLNMGDVVVAIAELGDAYGEKLLDKERFETKAWGSDFPDGMFYQKSHIAPHQDPI